MSESLENHRQQTIEFVRLFTDCSQRIHTYISILVPDEDAAADLFQDVSVTLWERFDQFRADTDFWAWAKQIVYYKVLNYRNRKRRPVFYVSDALLDELEIEADSAAQLQLERQRALADCFARLSATDRDLVEHRYAPGATTECVAEVTGRSLHQVYRALRRIHQSLFQCISQKMTGGSSG